MKEHETPDLSGDVMDLIESLVEIVRWATANLSPEFIRDTPIEHYRQAALHLRKGGLPWQLAGELTDVFNDYAKLAEAWSTRRKERVPETPFPVEQAAAYSRKVHGNAGMFEGAKVSGEGPLPSSKLTPFERLMAGVIGRLIPAAKSAMPTEATSSAREPGLLTRLWRALV